EKERRSRIATVAVFSRGPAPRNKPAGEDSPVSRSLTGLVASPRRSVCAPGTQAFALYRRPPLKGRCDMFSRNWFENLKTSCGLGSVGAGRRRSPLRKRNSSLCFQPAEVFEERRLLSAGALDPNFGGGGTATPSAAINGTASAVAVYSNTNAATAGDVVA